MSDTKEWLIDQLKEATQPFDLAKLEREGLLSRIGKGPWYRIHNPKALPEQFGFFFREFAQDSKGIKAKFSGGSRRQQQKLVKLLRELDPSA